MKRTLELLNTIKPVAFTARLLPKIGLLVIATHTTAAPAETHDKPWYEGNKDNAWQRSYDPTLISRRVQSEFSYKDKEAGASEYKIDPTIRGAIPLRENLALGYQIQQTYKWKDTGSEHISGYGDFVCRTGIVARVSDTLRWGMGMNFTFDTAEYKELGDNAFLLKPFAAFRWNANSLTVLGLTAEYTFTPYDEGKHDASYLEFKIPVSFKLSEQWSASVTYKPQWDLLDNENLQTIETSIGHTWGQNHQFSLNMGVELPLSNQSL